MDLNRLISRIENYLGKDLKFSMREFRQLQLLRDDVLKLEKIMAHANKEQFALLEHYNAHVREIERYSERIERRLNVWVRRLENLVIIEEQNLTAGDKRYFILWVNKIDICRNTLIKILARNGELHNLINEPFPDWKKVEAKINEALGDNQHPGLRTLIVLFQQLDQIEKRLGGISSQKITPEEYQKRLGYLEKHGQDFPFRMEPRLAYFLVKHWKGTIEMAKAAGYDARYLFRYGLPAVKDLINERTWPGMVEMAKAAGHSADFLFQYGLPAVKDLINERTWPMIVNGFIEMAKAAGYDARYLFRYGLPAVKGLINERNLPTIVKGLIEMAKAAGPNAEYLFAHGLPAVEGLINERTWPGMVEMAKYVKLHLGFMPKSLFDSIPKSKSFYDFDERLKKQIPLAKQYFNEVGFTQYTRKIIDENFWNFRNDASIFNRLEFEKTGSTLIPLGGRFKTKYLVRIISQESYEVWKKAEEANIPVEEIARAYPAEDGKVRVFCKYAGEQFKKFLREHPELAEEVERQKSEIIKRLKNLGIAHGHLHDENFCVAEENGKLVVRAIDFDMATSPPRQ